MNMHTDCYVGVGTNHSICEDYAACDSSFALVSDGCSMAPNSHIGAFLLAQATKKFIKILTTTTPAEFLDIIIRQIYRYSIFVDLPINSLRATLGVVYYQDRVFHVFYCGDGVIAARRKDQSWCITTILAESNAPLYPAYYLTPESLNQYYEEFPEPYQITNYDLTLANPPTNNISQKIKPNFLYQQYAAADFDCIALFSDGVRSFKEGSQKLEEYKILQHFLGFKNYTGSFVSRRCKSAFKHFAEANWQHEDDFSMSAIYHEMLSIQ